MSLALPPSDHCLHIQQDTYDNFISDHENDDECSICLSPLFNNGKYAKGHYDNHGDVPAIHAFHEECIDEWLIHKNNINKNCPTCRRVFTKVDPPAVQWNQLNLRQEQQIEPFMVNRSVPKISFFIGSGITFLALAAIINALSLSIFPTIALFITSAFASIGAGYLAAHVVPKIAQTLIQAF